MADTSPSSRKHSLSPVSTHRKAGIFARRRWLNPVETTHCDLILIAHCFCSGVIDATVFSNYSAFVAMQTGNTIILALSTASFPAGQPYAWLTTLVSILSFLVGAYTASHISYRVGPLRRVTLTTNLLLQGLLIALAAILVSVSGVGTPRDNHQNMTAQILSMPKIVTVIPPLAFQSGAQIATSKLMGVDEIPVNVVTSLYAGLMSDKNLFVWRKDGKWTWGWHTGDVKRTRRMVAVLTLFGGALCATWILRKGPGIVLCFWLGAGVKIFVAVAAGLGLGEQRDIHEK